MPMSMNKPSLRVVTIVVRSEQMIEKYENTVMIVAPEDAGSPIEVKMDSLRWGNFSGKTI